MRGFVPPQAPPQRAPVHTALNYYIFLLYYIYIYYCILLYIIGVCIPLSMHRRSPCNRTAWGAMRGIRSEPVRCAGSAPNRCDARDPLRTGPFPARPGPFPVRPGRAPAPPGPVPGRPPGPRLDPPAPPPGARPGLQHSAGPPAGRARSDALFRYIVICIHIINTWKRCIHIINIWKRPGVFAPGKPAGRPAGRPSQGRFCGPPTGRFFLPQNQGRFCGPPGRPARRAPQPFLKTLKNHLKTPLRHPPGASPPARPPGCPAGRAPKTILKPL